MTRNDFIVSSDAFRATTAQTIDAAVRGTPRLLILGESGTGKERLARLYHEQLGRSGGLVTINCATLNRDRMVADLFGAEAGAYTGAQRAVIGAVERADGGTLFLDEIGEMPLDVQAQLLRFLDTGEFQRLGSTGLTRYADTRLVAATNRELRAMVQTGTFRLDLFYRIALEIIEVPALRHRFSDVTAYLAMQSLGDRTALDALEPDAIQVLREHPWPGNFRELENLVRRMSGRGSIDADTIRRLLATSSTLTAPRPATTGDWLDWMHDAADAYRSDFGVKGPATWSEMTAFIEQYLKPTALAHMGGVADLDAADDVPAARVAETLRADRGTVVKQLRRYCEVRRDR